MAVKARNMTVGVEWKHILLFSLPILAGQFFQQLYNTVDSIVVSHFAGATQEACDIALAAVGGCVSLTFLFLAVAVGMSNGGAVLVSQLFGARLRADMKKAAATLFLAMLILGAAVSVLGAALARPIIQLLLDIRDPEVMDQAVVYFSIYTAGLVFQYTYNAVAATLRAVGDSKATLYFLTVAAVLNVVLDLFFVISFGWGAAGVAVATVIAQAACAVVSVIYMVRRYPDFRFFNRADFRADRHKLALILRLGIPATIQQMVISLGNVFVQRLVNSFGRAAMNAFTVGNRMEVYALIPLFSLNTSMATFTGQNVGAGRYDRVRRGWWQAILLAIAISGIVAVVLYTFAYSLADIFNVSGEARALAVQFIRFMSLFVFIFASYIPTTGLLQGAGDAIWSTISSLVSLSARVACAYFLALGLEMGFAAVWIATPVGWGAGLVVASSRYFSRRWMTKAVAGPAATGEALPESQGEESPSEL